MKFLSTNIPSLWYIPYQWYKDALKVKQKCKTLKITMHIVIYGSWDIYLLKLSQIDSNKVSNSVLYIVTFLCVVFSSTYLPSHTHKCLWTEQLDHWKSSNLWLIPQCNTLLWLLVSYWQAQPPCLFTVLPYYKGLYTWTPIMAWAEMMDTIVMETLLSNNTIMITMSL